MRSTGEWEHHAFGTPWSVQTKLIPVASDLKLQDPQNPKRKCNELLLILLFLFFQLFSIPLKVHVGPTSLNEVETSQKKEHLLLKDPHHRTARPSFLRWRLTMVGHPINYHSVRFSPNSMHTPGKNKNTSKKLEVCSPLLWLKEPQSSNPMGFWGP